MAMNKKGLFGQVIAVYVFTIIGSALLLRIYPSFNPFVSLLISLLLVLVIGWIWSKILNSKREEVIKMPNKDKTGPRASSQGPRDGRGEGRGRGRSDRSQKGIGAMKGGKKGVRDRE